MVTYNITRRFSELQHGRTIKPTFWYVTDNKGEKVGNRAYQSEALYMAKADAFDAGFRVSEVEFKISDETKKG